MHPSPSPAPPLQAELRKGIRLFKYSRRAQRKVPRVLSIDKTMSKLIWTPPMLGRTMRIATVHHVYRGQRTRSFRDVPRDRRGVEECCFSLVGVRQLNFEVASIKLRCVSFFCVVRATTRARMKRVRTGPPPLRARAPSAVSVIMQTCFSRPKQNVDKTLLVYEHEHESTPPPEPRALSLHDLLLSPPPTGTSTRAASSGL